VSAFPKERGDNRDVPQNRCGVREKEFAMAVEYAEAPCRKNQQRRAREKDPHQTNRQQTLFAMEAGRDDVDQPGRGEHADQHQYRGDEEEQRKDCFRDARCFFVAALSVEACVDRHERGGENTFAEEVLQEIWNAKRSAERICGVGVPKVMREDSISNEADEAAEKNTGGDSHGGSTAAGRCLSRSGLWFLSFRVQTPSINARGRVGGCVARNVLS